MKSALRWGGSLLLLTFLAVRLDWPRVAAAFASLRGEFWCLAALLYTGCQFLSALRWRGLARVVGFRASVGRYTGIFFIGSFFNLVLPTSVGGDVVRVWYLSGVRSKRATGRTTLAAITVLMDRVSGLVMLVALACVATYFSPVKLPTWVTVAVFVAALGTGAGVGFLVLGGILAGAVLRRVPRRLKPLLLRLLRAARLYLRHPRTLLASALFSIAIQALNVLVVWCIGLGLGLDVPLVCYGVCVPLATLLTLLPISLNGMGLREAGYALLLSPLGVPEATAVALAFLLFLALLMTSLVGLGCYTLGRFPRYVPAATEESNHDRSLGGDPDQGRSGQLAAAA